MIDVESHGFILRGKFDLRTAHIAINNLDDAFPLIALQDVIDVQRDDHFRHVQIRSVGLILIQVVRVKQVAKVQPARQRSLQ